MVECCGGMISGEKHSKSGGIPRTATVVEWSGIKPSHTSPSLTSKTSLKTSEVTEPGAPTLYAPS